ncbi:MAG: hypothetical protein LBU67_01865 [Oscillospiraceae bacterium]|jgi:hypothetical protein|nr:hypothetical protein [Oscillospiraceae bacterium]
MKCIDFDARFSAYVTRWMQANTARYKGNMESMEARMPALYLRWINAPASWLGGATPAQYMDGFDDPAQLVDWMCGYFAQGVPVPDLLLERIVALGDGAAVRLDALLARDDVPADARLTAIALLRELCSTLPMARYIAWIAACPAAGEREDMAAESLRGMGQEAVPLMLDALPQATPAGEELFLDILCNYPGDPRIFDLAMRKFAQETERRALFAGYLGKLGDAQALSALVQAVQNPATHYLDFIELRNAIEELGGDPPAERDFVGDPYYEAIKPGG